MDNETLNIISNAFANIGFPAAVCIALFYILFKQNKDIQAALNENTKVINELLTYIKLKNEK